MGEYVNHTPEYSHRFETEHKVETEYRAELHIEHTGEIGRAHV